MSYPTCPLGWQRHTSNPKEAEDMGVAWVDSDGYFCGPPGASPETLYKEDDPQYESQAALNKRIRDLTLEIKHTLNPEEYAKEIAEKKEKGMRQKEALSRSMTAKKAAQMEEDKSSRKKHVEKLTKVFKDHGFMSVNEAKLAAESLYDTALRCVSPSGDKAGCREVVDAADPKNIKKYYVPESLYVDEIGMATPLQIKGLEWWRTFRRTAESKRLIKDRKNLAMYV
jgi:hypothetical protein